VTDIYVGAAVRSVLELHADLLADYPGGRTVGEVLDTQARVLFEAFQREDPRARVQLSNWSPVGPMEPLTAEIARRTVEREHGFASPPDAERLALPLDAEFEAAVFDLLGGREAELAARLDATPDLVRRRSVFGHGATLLHYLATNGVETWRQVVPANAVAMAKLVRARGGDPRATMTCYGDRFTVVDLLETSAHPRSAGVYRELRAALDPQRRS
jgi:hypothetical protein